MMSPALGLPRWCRIGFRRSAHTVAETAAPCGQGDRDSLAARRDFIAETILSNPDAFSSELDICHLMEFFPERH